MLAGTSLALESRMIRTGLFSVLLLSGLMAIAAATPKFSHQLPANYHEVSAKQKLAYLWKQIETTEYETLPTYQTFENSVMKDILGILPQQLAGAFTNQEDVTVAGRQKSIHKMGSTAWFKFEPLDEGYRSYEGLIRLSNAINPERGDIYPSFAIKVPMDKGHSVNFQVGKSMDPQRIDNDPKGKPDFNFFRDDKLYPFSNELPFVPQTGLGKLFKFVLDRAHLKPNFLPVDQISVLMNKPAPRRLIFRAPVAIQKLMRSEVFQDEREVTTTKIPAGTVLFEVYESNGLGDDGKLVGKIVTHTRFVASSFQDRNLNFRHNDRDLKKQHKKIND